MATITITANLTRAQQQQIEGRISCVYDIPVVFISGDALGVSSAGYAICEDGCVRTVNTDYIEEEVHAVMNK